MDHGSQGSTFKLSSFQVGLLSVVAQTPPPLVVLVLSLAHWSIWFTSQANTKKKKRRQKKRLSQVLLCHIDQIFRLYQISREKITTWIIWPSESCWLLISRYPFSVQLEALGESYYFIVKLNNERYKFAQILNKSSPDIIFHVTTAWDTNTMILTFANDKLSFVFVTNLKVDNRHYDN